MLDLQNYDVVELNTTETLETEGGNPIVIVALICLALSCCSGEPKKPEEPKKK
jgi:hypothetical protein